MFLSQSIVTKAIDEIKSHPQWEAAYEIARKNTYGRLYLVGGQLYRTLAMHLHNTPGPVPVNASTYAGKPTDFDFVLTAEAKRIYLPREPHKQASPHVPVYGRQLWRWAAKPGTTAWQSYPVSGQGPIRPLSFVSRPQPAPVIDTRPHSLTAMHDNTGLKVDLISLKDITPKSTTKRGDIEDYFNAVPLDIQAIAWDLKHERLLGPGIKAIQERVIRWQAKHNLHESHNPDDYIRTKAHSMGFQFIDSQTTAAVNVPRPCTCDSRVLFNFGCRCGGS